MTRIVLTDAHGKILHEVATPDQPKKSNEEIMRLIKLGQESGLTEEDMPVQFTDDARDRLEEGGVLEFLIALQLGEMAERAAKRDMSATEYARRLKEGLDTVMKTGEGLKLDA